MKRVSWVAFYSQTGSEIVNLCKELNIKPAVVATNNPKKTSLENLTFFRDNNIILTQLPFNPTGDDYLLVHNSVRIITFHGWLRVVPPYICKLWKGRIFNGHPGLINKYPELKGKDPQLKAFELNMKTTGSVVHELIDEVDGGEIITKAEVDLLKFELEDYFSALRETSMKAWIQFFKFKQVC